MRVFGFCLLLIGLVSGLPTKLFQKLLIISFDGFRADFLGPELPWFEKFKSEGVYATSVQSVFPSETFPNHYSIVTGMYPESHGVVSNSMYDPLLNKTFSKRDQDPRWWNQAEPIWATAEKQRFKTSVRFWPGSIIDYAPEATRPSFYIPVYSDVDPSLEERLNETIKNFQDDGVRLAFLYYYQPDDAGHKFGIGSPKHISALQTADTLLGYAMRRLDEENLGRDRLNVVIVSDHGMVNVSRIIYLEDHLQIDDFVEIISTFGPVLNLQPKPGKLDRVLDIMKSERELHNLPIRVFSKTEVPSSLHYSQNRRIMDIVIVCDLGAYMKPTRYVSANFVGIHGYDPRHAEMQPLFMARGPAFKTDGYEMTEPFETKDIYALIAHVVGIEPRITNASLERVSDLFAPFVNNASRQSEQNMAAAMLLLVFVYEKCL